MFVFGFEHSSGIIIHRDEAEPLADSLMPFVAGTVKLADIRVIIGFGVTFQKLGECFEIFIYCFIGSSCSYVIVTPSRGDGIDSSGFVRIEVFAREFELTEFGVCHRIIAYYLAAKVAHGFIVQYFVEQHDIDCLIHFVGDKFAVEFVSEDIEQCLYRNVGYYL